ncbi:MAG: hypothetical protein KC503_36865 [Myxococcales bacterium]|nr:hypothetical protein [Myxococcales bacterium]
MQQKLAIARALLPEPELVILDEPTSALDPESARVVRDAIAELRGQERTVFLCTHNLAEAEQLCDRIAIFKRRLIRVDTLAALRRSLYGAGVRVRLASVPDDALVAKLQDLDFVGAVRRDEADAQALLVSVEDQERHNPELVRALVHSGAAVVYLEQTQATLERVYLDLIGEDEDESKGDEP